ncbi:MAG: hypothetical protein AABX38_02130 [Candidatus Micrarchaeota archaeon]
MSNVYITLDDKHEKMLRQLAQEKYQSKKGAISEVVQEAIENLKEIEFSKKEKNRAKARLLEKLDKGFDFGLKGRKAYNKRNDLYDR